LGFVVLGVLSILMILFSLTKLDHQSQIEKDLKTLPKIPGELLETSDINIDLVPDISTLIIFFNSECNHCQYEANEIQQKLSAFSGTNLLFISDEPKEKIIAFSKEFQLYDKENIWWLKMQPEDVYKTFGPIMVPHIWIYSKDGQLVKEFKGETKVEAILEWL